MLGVRNVAGHSRTMSLVDPGRKNAWLVLGRKLGKKQESDFLE